MLLRLIPLRFVKYYENAVFPNSTYDLLFVLFLQVDIPVHILGGETVLVTFTGVGYDQRIMGTTMPFRDEASTVPEHQLVQVTRQVSLYA